jgi:hypothetical protein
MLLKPVDHFFSKDGAGTEIPIKITGTESEPHFGLDFRDKRNRQGDRMQVITPPQPNADTPLRQF